MKRWILVVAAGGVLFSAAVLLLPRGEKGRPAPAEAVRSRAPGHPPLKSASARLPAKLEMPVLQESQLSQEDRTVILRTIEESAVTYDATALPEIERFLLHPDSEVRQAAMNGMIVLGDAAAGPLLRMAAKRASTPQEAVSLEEAADYVELPPGTFVPNERNAPGTRMPADGKRGEQSRLKRTPPEVRKTVPETAR